jgi:hypothetical protein
MKKLGTQRDANDKILQNVYKDSVRPCLEHGSWSWMTTAQSHQQSLHRVLNQVLCIIKGALRSTSIEKIEATAYINL